jgi:RNA-binding protein
MNLSDSQKKFLRGLGHQLKPVIMVGDAGLSESLLQEFCSTIEHHELIKIRVRAGDREQRDSIISDLCF